ncbi:MAG: squalene--hopene cyclase [Bdellovibrionota bacterium]
MTPRASAIHAVPTPAREDRLGTAVDRAVDHLFNLQDEREGFWWAELEANTTLTSEYVYLMHMLDRVDPERERQCRNELLAEQRPDGGWWIYHGGPSEISATIEAYVALKMTGEDPESAPMKKARAFIHSKGGLSKARVFTKIHLAILGLYDYQGTPTLPPWVMFFPERFSMSIYQMSSWARSCVVPLVILLNEKPVWKPKREITIDELYVEEKGLVPYNWPWNKQQVFSWDNFFIAVDHVLRFFEKTGLVPLRKQSLERAERWILQRQDDEGDWGGIIPAMAYSLLALKALGYAKEHPTMRKGWAAIERFGMDQGEKFRLQSCISPVWDTALAAWSLQEAGVPGDHPKVQKAARWLLSKQMHHFGDWAVKNREGRPGGWSFEFFNRYYPDCDDSSAAILALRDVELGKDNEYLEVSLERARQWVLSMQCQGGGWGAFDVDNDQELWNKIPFADLKAMLDPNTPDLTGRVLEMLGTTGRTMDDPVVERAVKFLLGAQEADGSWYGRWGVNYVYGTWAVLCGLRKINFPMDHEAARRGVEFLKRVQNPDGGWGESCASYDVGHFVPCDSCASQTAWAVMGLIAAGEAGSEPARRGIEWLLAHQKVDGRWDEPQFTGTGFPRHFYIRYHLYRDCFPLMALGQYAKVTGTAD